MEATGDVLELQTKANATARRVVERLTPEHFDNPTPCREWDVRALLNHLVVLNKVAAASITDGEQPDWGTDHLGDDPRGAFAAALSASEAALRGPGVLDQTFAMPWGEMTGQDLARTGAMDNVIHAWDLARASGQPADLDPDLCETVLALGRAMMKPEFRTPEAGFGPEVPVPAGAPVCDRLAGFFGRRP